ncbi:MAG: small ribosomal subunit Rsm22 family protein [Candidatus Sericytochromatia bacterium]
MKTYPLPLALNAPIESLLASYREADLRQAREQLTQRYRAERPGVHLASALSVAAYLATRLPATYGVMRAVWAQLQGAQPDWTPGSLLDLGAGPGTASLAALALWPELKQLTLVEQDRHMIAAGRELLQALAPATQAQWLARALPGLPAPQSQNELVVAAYVLNEMPEAARDQLIHNVLARRPTALALVEPGTPTGFRHLLAARADFLAAGWQIWAPCPLTGPCPLPADDWCHFAVRVPRSRLHRQLKEGVHGHEDEKYACLIVGPQAAPHPAPSRIVRHPQPGKGHIELTLCQGTQVAPRTLGKSHADYRQARKADWGDVFPAP